MQPSPRIDPCIYATTFPKSVTCYATPPRHTFAEIKRHSQSFEHHHYPRKQNSDGKISESECEQLNRLVMQILELDVNDRISKQAFAQAYEAATGRAGYEITLGSSTKIARPIHRTRTVAVATVYPISNAEEQGKKTSEKTSETPVYNYLTSLSLTLDQQNDRITELNENQQRSMMQLQEAIRYLQSS